MLFECEFGFLFDLSLLHLFNSPIPVIIHPSIRKLLKAKVFISLSHSSLLRINFGCVESPGPLRTTTAFLVLIIHQLNFKYLPPLLQPF